MKALVKSPFPEELYGSMLCQPRNLDTWKVYRDRAVAEVQDEIRKNMDDLKGGLSFQGDELLYDRLESLRIVNFAVLSGVRVNIMIEAAHWKNEARRLQEFIGGCNRKNMLRMTVRTSGTTEAADIMKAIRKEGCAVRCELTGKSLTNISSMIRFFSNMCPAFIVTCTGDGAKDAKIESLAEECGRRIIWKQQSEEE